jgi:pimeloyl-ACP methyl ester carboxylesterase
MGVKVVWGYVELYGTERIAKLVLADDSPSLLDNPGWLPRDRSEVGPMYKGDQLANAARDLMSSDGERLTAGMMASMFTPEYCVRRPDELQWVISENLKMPRNRAAQLLYAIATIDWRETLKRIDVPTLVMGGEKSTHNTDVIRWEASQIKGAKVRIWTAREGGSHFVFLENPEAFNAAVIEFLDWPPGIS